MTWKWIANDKHILRANELTIMVSSKNKPHGGKIFYLNSGELGYFFEILKSTDMQSAKLEAISIVKKRIFELGREITKVVFDLPDEEKQRLYEFDSC